MLFMVQKQILHSFYQFFPPPSWQLMLFMIQKQILHSFYQFFPPALLATNAFHDSNANITFPLSIFSPPPPSWQLMLFMVQKQILHSFYQFFPPSPLLATNAVHDSNANITFLLSIFFPLGN